MRVRLSWVLTTAVLALILSATGVTAAAAPSAGHALQWKAQAALQPSRYALAASVAGDGSIFAIGGADTAGSSILSDVQVLAPHARKWRSAPSLPSPRYRLAAATGGDGRIYAIGGSDATLQGAFLNSVLALSPGAEQWVPVASMPTARQLLGAVTGADGRIYAIGGHNLSAGALNVLEIYDPATNEWTEGAPMSTPRYGMGVALGGDGRIYAIGGVTNGVVNILDSVEAYSPSTKTWSPVAALPAHLAGVHAAAGPDGRIYAVGGCDAPAGNGADCVNSKQVNVYSPQTDTWETVTDTDALHWEGAAVTSLGRIFAIGGHIDVVESARVPK